MLRDVASLLAGGDVRPDLDRLERSRARSLAAAGRALDPRTTGFRDAARLSFHAHAIAVAVLAIAADALVAARLADPDWVEVAAPALVCGSRRSAR